VASLEKLVDELERSYGELQRRMADPAVYNDHREAADVGRRLQELERPHKLALAWREADWGGIVPGWSAPFDFEEDRPGAEQVRAFARQSQVPILVGSDSFVRGDPNRYYNSAFLVRPDGSDGGVYASDGGARDKSPDHGSDSGSDGGGDGGGGGD